ncbi:unnamed protein product, partial [Choristocarpus tenellus]
MFCNEGDAEAMPAMWGMLRGGAGSEDSSNGIFASLPDVLLLEISGYLKIGGLGRCSCTCQTLWRVCSNELLWLALWEGPLPEGVQRGGKAAHLVQWLLAHGHTYHVEVHGAAVQHHYHQQTKQHPPAMEGSMP